MTEGLTPYKDRHLLERVFRENYQALCYFASGLLHDDEASEDVVQDVFLRIAASEQSFDNDSHLRSYLYIAVRNSCINVLRRNHDITDIGNDAWQLPTENESDTEIVRSELIRMISDAINTLSPRYREVFIAAYVRGLKNEEVAKELGISVNTVKVMKRRSRDRMREMLHDIYPIMLTLLGF